MTSADSVLRNLRQLESNWQLRQKRLEGQLKRLVQTDLRHDQELETLRKELAAMVKERKSNKS